MQKYQDYVFAGGAALRPISGASVLVKTYPAGTTATIYSDNGVTLAVNPLTTDSAGFFSFYATDGRYTLVVSGTGMTTVTESDILLEDPAVANAIVATTITASGLITANAGVSGTTGAFSGAVTSYTTEKVLNAGTYGLDNTGATSITTARNTMLVYAAANGYHKIYYPPGSYKFSTAPAIKTQSIVEFTDPGFGNGAAFLRDYTPSAGAAFIDINASQAGLENITLWAATGTSNGYAIRSIYGASDGFDYNAFKNLYITGAGTWQRGIHGDGSARSGGAGLRDWVIRDCRIFQCTEKDIYLKSVNNLTIDGGGAFETGGSPTHGVHIDGTVGSPSTGVNVSMEFLGKLELTYTTGMFTAPNITTITVDTNSAGAIFTGINSPSLSGTYTNVAVYRGKNINIPGTLTAVTAVVVGAVGSNAGPFSVTTQGTAPSGTSNTYGLHVTPQAAGEILLDALTNSTNNTSMKFRTYNNTTYNNNLTLNNDGSVTTGGLVTSTAGINFGDQTLANYKEGTFTPTANSFTVVGTPTLTGRYTRIGRIFKAQILHSSTTSVASTAGTSNYTGLPFTVAQSEACAGSNANIASGTGFVSTSGGGTVYPATFAASSVIVTSFVAEI